MTKKKTIKEIMESPEFKEYAKKRGKNKKEGWTVNENGEPVYIEPSDYLKPPTNAKKKAK